MKNKGCFYVFLFFVIFFTFTIGVRDTRGEEDRIIAIVNDDIITESELKSSKIFSQQSISFLIDKKLQLQTSKKKGVSILPSEVQSAIEDIKKANSFSSEKEFEDALLKEGTSVENYKTDLIEQLTLIKIVSKEIKAKITINNKELEEYYSLNKNLFSRPEEVRIGYVYISVKQNDPIENIQGAKNLINDLLLALRSNMSLNEIKSRYRGNSEINVIEDMGYVKKGDIVQELDNVAFSLKEGDVSDMIITPSGFYIIKILEKKEFEYKPFSEVKDMITDRLFHEKNEKLYKDWLYDIKSSAYVDIK